MTLPNAQTRQYIYSVVVAAVPVLLLLGVITPSDVEIWLQLAAALLGLTTTATAAFALKQQRRTGEVDPGGRHAKPES